MLTCLCEVGNFCTPRGTSRIFSLAFSFFPPAYMLGGVWLTLIGFWEQRLIQLIPIPRMGCVKFNTEDVFDNLCTEQWEDMPEDTPEDMPECMPEDLPEDILEDMPEDMPEDIPKICPRYA